MMADVINKQVYSTHLWLSLIYKILRLENYDTDFA